jgi:2'-5' RNA ligase
MLGMENLDHKTAAVIIPPEDVWGPIQAIRQKHDSKVGRWMPHITLIYPFLPRSRFGRAAKELVSACRSVKPFEIELARFDQFGHGKGYFTLWLAPEPDEPIKDLHAALCPVVYEDAHDSGREIWHFKPHLSVGQARGMGNMVKLIEELQAGWRPIRFRVDSVQLIWRNDRPDDAFRIDRTLALQGG